MIAEILVLCDNAQVYQNKMVVVGPFNSITSTSFPFIQPAFNLACRLSYDKAETPVQETIKVTFNDANGEAIMPSIDTILNIPQTDVEEVYIFNFVLGFVNVNFNKSGKYSICINIGAFSRIIPLYIKEKK